MSKNKNFHFAKGMATSVFAFIATSQASFAQDDIDLIDDDTIIVTGTKQGLTTQEAEVSVDIFDEARLDEEALFRLDDVLSRVPNVDTTGGVGITIRGIGRQGVSGVGVTSNVYLDGAPIASAALSTGFDTVWDIAQIEVLRGPQSTVQGRNALAGAIVLRTADPTYEWETKLRARYGSFDSQQFAGSLSGPIIEDQLAFRLAADYQSDDRFITNGLTLEDQNRRENLMIRGKLLVEPEAVPGLRAEFTADYNETNGGGRNFAVTPPTNILTPEFYEFDFDEFVTFNLPFTNDAEILRILTDVEYELNDNLDLQFIGTFEDSDVVNTGGDVTNPLQFDGLIADNSTFIDSTDTETYSAELRLFYEYGRWSGSIGGYYFEDSNVVGAGFGTSLARSVGGFVDLDPPGSVTVGSSTFFNETRNYAFYGQTRFEMNEKWTFDFSIRYDNERFISPGETINSSVVPDDCLVVIDQARIDLFIPGSGLTAPLSCNALVDFFSDDPDGESSTTFSAILPRGAITYNINDDLSVFFSGQRGYRSGGVTTFVENNQFQVQEFGPEFLTTYEVGFRSQMLDGDLTFNGNFYYSLYNDQQVTVAGATDLQTRTQNAGESRLYGAEFIGNYRVSDELSLNASVGLQRAEFVDFEFQRFEPDAEVQSQFQNLEGNLFPNAPTLSFNIGANYEHASGFFTNFSVAYSGPRETDIFNLDEEDFTQLQTEPAFNGAFDDIPLNTFTERLGSRVVGNARIGYSEDRFTFYVYGTNLFNDNTPVGVGGGIVVAEPPAVASTPETGTLTNGLQAAIAAGRSFAPPRVVGIGLDLSF
ncbi:MAG: TonB-dependent receptor [Pseudomonadota bacterium]